MEIPKKDFDKIVNACEPIVAYLNRYGTPYDEICITQESIRVNTTICGIPVKNGD